MLRDLAGILNGYYGIILSVMQVLSILVQELPVCMM
jgi:hypothetical protein